MSRVHLSPLSEVEFPIPVICPECHSKLERSDDKLRCTAGHEFMFSNGFPDLTVGGRFEDASSEEQLRYEERFNTFTTENYFIPLFRRLWPSGSRRLLSLGCGTGTDVDALQEAGFECIGIDCGNRTDVWPRRRHHRHFLLANGKHLPFESETFDGVFCGCVFPHVGVVGDSYQVTRNYDEERSTLAKEMTRVLKSGGRVLASGPNRLFPFDIFHGRAPGCYTPRRYSPRDPFLLSLGDYSKLFENAGCRKAEAQPPLGYWGFLRSRTSLKGYLLGLPVRMSFWLVSQPGLRFLRASPLTPWIVVLAEKR